MRLIVDALPTEAEDCMFMKYVECVHDDDICEDCGGLLPDAETELICGCWLT